MYIQSRREDGAAHNTVKTHRSRLNYFVDWFQSETDYEHVRELSGLDTRRFRTWRFDGDYSPDSIRGQLHTLTKFLRFCVAIDAVDEGLPEKVQVPRKSNGQRSNEIDHDRAEAMLEHLDRYDYASLTHALVRFLWFSMARVSGAHSLDLDDLDLTHGYAEIRYRPSEGTTLKNGEDSERDITLDDRTCRILEDYIEHTRPDVTDEYGREPLFVVPQGSGRPHTTSLRGRVYAASQPCSIGWDCPEGRDSESCAAARNLNRAHECPVDGSESTHAIRRGSISWHLRQDTPKQIVSERADVGVKTLEEHYSTLTEREKADVREEYLPDSL